MIPKLKVQTWKSSMNSTEVVILINGTVNTMAKIQTDANQKPGDTNCYYSLEWIKHQEKAIQGSHKQTCSGHWHLTNKLTQTAKQLACDSRDKPLVGTGGYRQCRQCWRKRHIQIEANHQHRPCSRWSNYLESSFFDYRFCPLYKVAFLWLISYISSACTVHRFDRRARRFQARTSTNNSDFFFLHEAPRSVFTSLWGLPRLVAYQETLRRSGQ